MKSLSIKQISLIAVLAALVVGLNLIPYTSFVALSVFIILALSLRRYEAMILGLVVGFVMWLTNMQVLTALNIVFLPLIALSLKLLEKFIYGRKLSDGCLTRANKPLTSVKLGLVSFILVLIPNIASELIYAGVIVNNFDNFLGGLPFAIGGALLTGLIVGLIGIPLQLRLNKAYFLLNK